MRARQGEEQADAARHAVQQPAAAHVRKQADGYFRHRQARGLADHPVAGAHHQADAAAHDDPMPPAQHRLRIRVDAVVQPVFVLEEAARIRVAPTALALVFAHAAVQAVQVAASAERFLARALQNHQGHARIAGPFVQARRQQVHHFQRQAVQGLRRVQRRNPEPHAVRSTSFFEQHRCIHLMSAPFSNNWRAMITRMISLVPSRI
ncbi:hypothetical protein G6F57_020271 [Rhizopus arrhizus]|nr:hypothetical protein G6F57_020271 [Rhizopus arrhizus]